ncbi:OmpA family protein [Labilibaculum sp. DW002]|uniref:OmpA family protein n=1 Tax=Paralabilibaculum antarcticum TaxID=2912572 RepID=A0ABT5VU52_9BACT|nr:OmpA family protein [Labilibaculum sp. DW002]MDE5418959.1 OmpA family protein [Labilibaculum sp. DW002]
MFRHSFILIICLLIGLTSNGQKKYSIKSKKAIKNYEAAAETYRQMDNVESLKYLEQAVEKSPKFIEAWLFMADVLHETGETQKEIAAYLKAIEISPDFFSNVHFNLGNAYLKIGEYEKAQKKYKDFLAIHKISSRNKALAKSNLKNCQFALEAISNPVDFNPENLGETVNSKFDEYWPSLTADEELLVFTRLVGDEKEVTIKRQEDFYYSYKQDSLWLPSKPLSTVINTAKNEGAQSITADGKYMYFTACSRPDGYGRCDIYYSVKEGSEWSTPINLGKPINSKGWEAQPSISADGQELYFVSNRKSGKGKMDIWHSRLIEIQANGKPRWTQPENLSINSSKNEMSPFIHAGNRYLVFSSDGLTGMGGYDLFKTELDEDQKWSEPVNMGYPINTYHDEVGLVVTARGDKAYFSSDRLEGKGKDIFSFDMPIELQPPSVSWLKGNVLDAKTRKPIYASLMLIDLQNKDTISQIKSDRKNGNYLVCLPAGRDYLFSAKADDYLFYSDHFEMLDQKKKTDPQILDINLSRVEKGSEIVLRNVFFELDSWEILPKSEIELEYLFDLLLKNEEWKIEIGGHTDNSGSEDHNISLSNKRAKAVCDFLISSGIDKDRLQFKGYGASQPIATNDSEKGRSVNRRTEFKILEK